MDDRTKYLDSLVGYGVWQLLNQPGSAFRLSIDGMVENGNLSRSEEAYIWAAVGDRLRGWRRRWNGGVLTDCTLDGDDEERIRAANEWMAGGDDEAVEDGERWKDAYGVRPDDGEFNDVLDEMGWGQIEDDDNWED